MPQSFACLYYHLVFSTKERMPLITANLCPRLQDYIGGILRMQNGLLLTAGGASDHQHLLIQGSKNITIPDTVRDIKSNSSRWIHETFPELSQFAWQEGYGAFTISYPGLRRVKGYLTRQEAHHRTVTFQEEFLTFLKLHGQSYDARYVWD